MVEQIAADEKKRVSAQKKRLGSDGIKKSGDDIEAAIKENTANKPSKELLDEMIVKELEKFDRFPVVTFNNIEGYHSSSSVKSDISGSTVSGEVNNEFIKQFPFTTHVHNIPTNFVEVGLLFF